MVSILKWGAGLFLAIIVFVGVFAVPLGLIGMWAKAHGHKVDAGTAGFVYPIVLGIAVLAASFVGSRLVSENQQRSMVLTCVGLFVLFTGYSFVTDVLTHHLNATTAADVVGTALGVFWVRRFLLKPYATKLRGI